MLMQLHVPACTLLLLSTAVSVSTRRVNWFNAGGDWTIGVDGLDFAGWLEHYGPASSSPAITGAHTVNLAPNRACEV
eukprot:COSAG02_NODE_3973_length_5970_cov_1.807529_4_plen_77_part_00